MQEIYISVLACSQVASLLLPHFRAGLSRGLAKTARNWSKVAGPAEQGRLAPLVESLATRCTPALGPARSWGEVLQVVTEERPQGHTRSVNAF